MTSAPDAGRYELKPWPLSSHGRILGLAASWPRGARILEVGTAAGYLGRELRSRGFEHLVGVEIDPACAASAEPYYEQHVTRDLERERLDDLGTFDVVICADVLEHLREPLDQLRALTQRLAAGGIVVVSLPNAVNWVARVSVAAGRFEYADRGLFDRGHLRFFTRRTARALVEDAGLVVERVLPTPLPIGLVTRAWLPAPAARAAEWVYTGGARAWSSVLAYQFVLLGRKPGARGPGRQR